MLATDPWGAAIVLGLAAAPFCALLVRRGRRGVGAALGALLGTAGALGAARLGTVAPPPALAALAGAVAALGIPGRRSFGSAYPRAAAVGFVATAPLPVALRSPRPSRLLDAAARLQLESELAEVERKHDVQAAIALLARAGEVEGAHARATLFGAALAASVAVAAGATSLAALGAAGVGAVVLRGMARIALVRRLFVSEAALGTLCAQAASDVFAHAALGAAPGGRGLLVCAALFEARVCVLAGPGLCAPGAESALDSVARAAADGIAGGRAREAFAVAVENAARLSGPAARTDLRAAPPRPYPVRVED
jgi:hypothetical protein